jgi:hypothetical protein
LTPRGRFYARLYGATRPTTEKPPAASDHVWSLGELIDAALATQPIDPVVTAPQRRKRFRVIDGGLSK